MTKPHVENAEDIPEYKQGGFQGRVIRNRRGPRDSATGKQTLEKDPHLGRLSGCYQAVTAYGNRPRAVVPGTHHLKIPIAEGMRNRVAYPLSSRAHGCKGE